MVVPTTPHRPVPADGPNICEGFWSSRCLSPVASRGMRVSVMGYPGVLKPVPVSCAGLRTPHLLSAVTPHNLAGHARGGNDQILGLGKDMSRDSVAYGDAGGNMMDHAIGGDDLFDGT